jgi:hypothetical protein
VAQVVVTELGVTLDSVTDNPYVTLTTTPKVDEGF